MYDLNTLAKEVGLLEPSAMQKTSSVQEVIKDSVYAEIMAYLKEDTLSNYLEKEASVPADVIQFVRHAEENGIPESEITEYLLEKKGYKFSAPESTPVHNVLLEKAADRISHLEKRFDVMDTQLEMIKVAMDLVAAGECAPFTDFDELTNKVAKLIHDGNPEIVKKAVELYQNRFPSMGKISSTAAGGGTARERFESTLVSL
jgi:hypothetical protein